MTQDMYDKIMTRYSTVLADSVLSDLQSDSTEYKDLQSDKQHKVTKHKVPGTVCLKGRSFFSLFFLLLMLTFGATTAWGQSLPFVVTTDDDVTNHTEKFYWIESVGGTGFHIVPHNNNTNASTTNAPTLRALWYFMESGESGYYYIINKETGKYLKKTGQAGNNNTIQVATYASADDVKFKFSFDTPEGITQGSWVIYPKDNSGNDKTGWVGKQSGNLQFGQWLKASIWNNTPVGDLNSQWIFVPRTTVQWPQSGLPFVVSTSSDKHYYNINHVNSPTYNVSYDGDNYVTISTEDDKKKIWYFVEAATDANIDNLKYYYIVNAQTEKYLKFTATTINGSNQADNFILSDYAAGDADRFQFVVVNSYDNQGKSWYSIMPKLAMSKYDVSNYANSMAPASVANNEKLDLRTDRNTDKGHWVFVETDYGTVEAPIITNNFDGTISLSTATDGATIYYTTNGDTPDNTSTEYSSAFSLGDATVIKAITYLGSESSDVTTYDVPQYDAPTISFNNSTSLVTINPGSGGTAYYNTGDGSQADPTTESTEYSEPFTVSSATTIKAIATHAGYLTSEVATLAIAQVATPTIQDNGSGAVSITSATEGATIYYTTNGSTPTTSSTEYTEPLTGNYNGVTFNAIAVKEGMINSAVGSGSVTIACSTPTFVRTGKSVTISCSFPTSGVTIQYAIGEGGTIPDSPNTGYTGTIDLSSKTLPITIIARASAEGYPDSEIATLTITSFGDGTAENPYVIASNSDFTQFISDVNNDADKAAAYYQLQCDINAGGVDEITRAFTGTLEGVAGSDGLFPTISGLSHALFNTIDGGTVKNITFTGVAISSSADAVGAIAGTAKGYSRIYNCGILPNSADFPAGTHPTVTTTGACAGGIVGSLEDDSRVINCYSYADVSAATTAAGIVGNNTVASTAAVSGDKYTNLRTAVVNCMFYGNITGGTNQHGVYGGQLITNADATGINSYNYYRSGSTFSTTSGEPTAYNCSFPAEERYLTQVEFHRSLLNSNRELCGWWVGSDVAPSTLTTAEVQAIPKDASLMAKWVLDTSVAPYPILKPFGKYASVINSPGNQTGKTLSVKVQSGSGSTAADKTISIPITNMDPQNHDYGYYKVQLPYFNTVFGDPDGTTWVDKYAGNYTDQVVTGWKVTAITTDGTIEDDDYNSFVANWETGYNFADRKCTDKDLYETSGRVFAQGGYYYVPDGVTAITIEAYWGKAIYVRNAESSYDRVNITLASTGSHFAPAGTRGNNVNDATIQTTSNLKAALTATNIPTKATVYDYALVLVGNVQESVGKKDFTHATDATRGYTIMSVDLDFDEEPDYCLEWQLGADFARQVISPIRFDFLPVVELGIAGKLNGSTSFYSLGCFRSKGHFEVTETAFIRFGQFEFELNDRDEGPIILNGGIYDQYSRGRNNETNQHINYVILGGHVVMPSFTPGAHANKNAKYQTRHCAVNALGGDFTSFYLTGGYNEGITPYDDNPHCYIDGGHFGTVAAAYKEGISGNVTWRINHALIDEFYGGGVMSQATGSDYKIVKGNIDVVIDNSTVGKYCGGPKFGDMVSGKTVTTSATNTVFTQYFGAGNGGTNYIQYTNYDNTGVPLSAASWGSTTVDANYHVAKYRNTSQGYEADYNYEVINGSDGTSAGKVVNRVYYYSAQFATTNTGNVTNTLTGCTIETSFYGGGFLGGVNGNVTSTLTDCIVNGNAFGAGYSADAGTVTIHNKDKVPPVPNVYTGIIKPQSGGTSSTYYWTNDYGSTGSPITDASEATNNRAYFYTEVPLDNLGTVTGKVTLNIEGTTTVAGSVYGGGEQSGVDGDTEVNVTGGTIGSAGQGGATYGNVYGGGKGKAENEAGEHYDEPTLVKMGLVKGNTKISISEADSGTPTTIYHNIYGGGAYGSVGDYNYDATTGLPTSLKTASTGKTEIYITGGTIGDDGVNDGMVFGSSRGDVDRLGTIYDKLAWVNDTHVAIGDSTKTGSDIVTTTPLVKGSVYGGGENGHTLHSTYIRINGGTIGINSDGNVTYTDPAYSGKAYDFPYRGNVYGGGCGTDKYYSIPANETHDGNGQLYNPLAGIVQGDATVRVTGGHVVRNVYGAGAMGSVGTITNFDDLDDPTKGYKHAATKPEKDSNNNDIEGAFYDFGLSWPYKFTYDNTGQTSVTIEGSAVIGVSGSKGGHVFGAARGAVDVGTNDITEQRYVEAKLANVRQTQVTIGTSGGTATTPTIYGSVYGGGEDGHVNEDAFVTIHHGRIDHSVFGGGKGESTYDTKLYDPTKTTPTLKEYPANSKGEPVHSWTAGKVYGNTTVTMNGGSVGNNIYGGGNLASVGKGNYAGGSDDYSTVGYGELGEKQSDNNGGPIWTDSTTPDTYPYYFMNSGLATVTIKNGKVGVQADGTTHSGTDADGNPYGNVFGSSRGKAAMNVGQLSPRYRYVPDFFLGYVNQTEVTIGDGTNTPVIFGSVYGGGQDGHVRRSTSVIINKSTIGHTDTSHSDAQIEKIGNVFGAGSGLGQYNKGTADSPNMYYNNSSGSVTCTTNVQVNANAYIYRNVYGGGALASVGPPFTGQPIGIETKSNAETDTKKSVSFTQVDINGGTILGDVYGSSRGGSSLGANWYKDEDPNTYATNLWSTVNVSDGAISGNVFGGGEAGQVKGSVEVNISGGTITKDVYGGGALAHTNTSNWVYNRTTGVWGDTWATGMTNTDSNGKTTTTYKTTVNLTGGTISGNAYGGGLGIHDVGEVGDADYAAGTPAYVYGDVLVELNNLGLDDNDAAGNSAKSTKGCSVTKVFGCNNLKGTPKGHVKVHVYATQNASKSYIQPKNALHSEDDHNLPETGTSTYDVLAVYGGGNLAPYEPAGEKATTDSTEVIIDGCYLTSIKQVYAGGNAAPAPATYVRVNGAYEIEELFGGGNGKDEYELNGKTYLNPGANVGYYNYTHAVLIDDTSDENYGKYDAVEYTAEDGPTLDASTKEKRIANHSYGNGVARTEIAGGRIHYVYGGSNERGNISKVALSKYEQMDDGCPMITDQTYGGGKNSEIDATIKMELGCVQSMAETFGGSKNADVNSDIVLNITNGTYGRVFGGNNTSGNINGSITVNIKEEGCSPVRIGGLYLGGYLADYSIYGYNTDGSARTKAQYDGLSTAEKAAITVRKDPRINVISATRIDTIYGGGYQALVVGNPHVNVNMEKGKIKAQYVDDDFTSEHTDSRPHYAWKGESVDASGDGILPIGTIGTIYGGGNRADIYGNTYVEIGTGQWLDWDDSGNEIWKCKDASDGKTYTYIVKTHASGTTPAVWAWYDGTTEQASDFTPTPARNAATITGNVYGGGKGVADHFECNKAMVGVDNESVDPTKRDGGTSVIIANGSVGSLDDDGKLVEGTGNVYGGGEIGRVERNTMVTIGLGSGTENGAKNPIIMGNVFGAGSGKNTHGYSALVRGNSTVTVQGNAWVKKSVYGGGEIATVGKYAVNSATGLPTTPERGGLCTVTVQGWAEIGPDNMQMTKDGGPDDVGYVFGACKGTLPYDGYKDNEQPYHMDGTKEGDSWVDNPRNYTAFNALTLNDKNELVIDENYMTFINTLALASNTEVTIGGHAFVKGAVYGGSENGHVQANTHVTIQDDCQIGNGDGINRRYSEAEWTYDGSTAAKSLAECAHWPYGDDTNHDGPYNSYDVYKDTDSDGTPDFATDGNTFYGNVFGGGSGYFPYHRNNATALAALRTKDAGYADGLWHREAGSVGGNTVVDITGGHILTNVYGGNELTDVAGSCTINMSGGTVGVPRTEAQMQIHPVTCNVFGGAKGDSRVNFNDMTKVKTNTQVNISGTAHIFGSAYGGGEMGDVEGNTEVNVCAEKQTNGAYVVVSGTPTIGGNVFGGGKGSGNSFTCAKAMVGINDDGACEEPGSETNKDKGTKVNIFNGTVNGNVYGGGEISRVEWNTAVTIGAESGTSTPMIIGDVFGAGAGLETHGYSALVRGNSTVTVQAKAKVLQNVYGGGEKATVGRYWVTNIPATLCTGEERPAEPDLPNGMPYQQRRGGICRVTIEGEAQVGPDDGATETAGHVFGAGKGVDLLFNATTSQKMTQTDGLVVFTDETDISGKTVKTAEELYYEFLQTLALVTKSYVTIDETAKVKGSVYGGSESGFVQTDTEVKIQGSCTIGTTTSDGDVFGGGKGLATFAEAGKVKGNTKVEISGGTMYGNVYGGGSLGDVGTISKEFVSYNYKWKQTGGKTDNVANNNDESKDHSDNTGICTVEITGGKIGISGSLSPKHGNVFGAGRGLANTFWCEKAMAFATDVSIKKGSTSTSNPEVYGNVYGGGEVGRVEDDSKVIIGTSGGTDVPVIKGSVYGAGAGKETHGYSALVRGNSIVTVQGAAKVGANVFGGGEKASLGRFVLDENKLPKEPQDGGYSTVTIKDNAEIGTEDRGDVYGAGQGEDPSSYKYEQYTQATDYETRTTNSKRMTLHVDYNATTGKGHNPDNQYKTWDYYEDDHTYVWEYYPTLPAYQAYLNTLAIASHPTVEIGGSASVNGSVFGGGQRGITLGNVNVSITGGTVTEDVYGGGALADTNKGNWDDSQYNLVTGLTVDKSSVTGLYTRTGTVGNYTYTEITGTNAPAEEGKDYYRKGYFATGKYDSSDQTTTYKTNVTLTGGTIEGNVYGGGLGARYQEAVQAEAGHGNPGDDDYEAPVAGQDEVTAVEAKVYGDVLVKLNETTASDDCEVKGKIFGCNNENGSPQNAVTVHVYKTVHKVNGSVAKKYDKETNQYELEAVYGGGNLAAYVPANALLDYSVTANKALVEAARASVIIEGCDDTSIRTVYGGGNAASSPATNVTINSTYEIEEVFGGGDGHGYMDEEETIPNPGANVGYYHYPIDFDPPAPSVEERTQRFAYGSGEASVNIYGGRIHRVFGGSNTKGNVRRSAITVLDNQDPCLLEVDEAYGGGKSAPMDAEAQLLMACIPGLKAAYGGAQDANIENDVILNITNGTFDRVFGGNNVSGTISGSITVNIEETGCKPLIIGQLYGGGNQAAYTGPWKDENDHSKGRQGPTVNVRSFTSIGDIYGGGYGETAVVTGDTHVNIEVCNGKYASRAYTENTKTISFSEYKRQEGEGEASFVTDPDTGEKIVETKTISVLLPGHAENAIGAINNVYGGGNAAKVDGNTFVNIGTESVVDFETDDADTDEIDESAVPQTVVGADIRGNVYGGGNEAETTGDTKVVIGISSE